MELKGTEFELNERKASTLINFNLFNLSVPFPDLNAEAEREEGEEREKWIDFESILPFFSGSVLILLCAVCWALLVF